MSPQDPPVAPNSSYEGGVSFASVIEDALVELGPYRSTYQHALSIGIRPVEIVRYVRGTMSGAERDAFTSHLGSSPWAMDRVAALIKARRDETSLRYRVHTVSILNHYARKEPWDDEDLEGAKLLDRL